MGWCVGRGSVYFQAVFWSDQQGTELHKRTSIQVRFTRLFEIDMGRLHKKMYECSYGMDKLLNERMNRLLHKSDGLIFTSVNAPYEPGTCEKMWAFSNCRSSLMISLKWKPADENTVDFKLQVKRTKEGPKYMIYIWLGEGKDEFISDLEPEEKDREELVYTFNQED